jgi:polar amino acid transport system permease protein
MVVLLLCYVGLVGVLVFVMHCWERSIRVPGFGPASD